MLDGEFDVGIGGGVGGEIGTCWFAGGLGVAGLRGGGDGEAADGGDGGDGEVDVLAWEVSDVGLKEGIVSAGFSSKSQAVDGSAKRVAQARRAQVVNDM